MSKYADSSGLVYDIGSPELNPELIKNKTLVPESTPTGSVINLSTLQSNQTPYAFQPTPAPAIPSISGIDATTQKTADELSQPEKNVSDFTAQITKLQNSLLGKSTYQTQQETAAGLPELTKTQNDLTAQIKALQLESQDLANKANYTIPNQIQQESEGRGRTMGGIAPLLAGELRKIQIQQGDIASRTLTASATLNAIQGNIATAKDQVDRAVQAKYSPAEEAIKVALANLEILLKDPALTKGEKDRANAQQIIQQAKLSEITQKKQDATDAKNEVLKYANIADSATLAEMMKATSALQVAQIANSKGLKTLEQQKQEADIKTKQEIKTKQTETERATEALSGFSSAFTPGAKYQGIEVIGTDGNIDPRVWKAAIADAPSEGLNRKQFIEQFGYLINTKDKKTIAEYGLTPTELKLITGEL